MKKFMAFLMKYIGGFFTWWQELTKLPTIKYSERLSVNWSLVVFWILLIVGMVVFLP